MTQPRQLLPGELKHRFGPGGFTRVHHVLALDIGGANLKAAHTAGVAKTAAFDVWKQPRELGRRTAELIKQVPPFERLAVTMTAELCDCFATKSDGVQAVLDAVEFAVSKLDRPAPVWVWLTDGRLVRPAQARAESLKAAASNWLALATWAGRHCPEGPALLIDVGSTTTDIVPLRDGLPVPHGRTDTERLSCGELVYSGVRRTPIFALTRTVELGGQPCRIAAELFATTQDVYVWLGDLAEQSEDCDTPDGRPSTRDYAADRLARVVCADRTMLAESDIDSIAREVAAAQFSDMIRARRQVETRLRQAARTIMVAGSGEFLARRVATPPGSAAPRLVSLAEQYGDAISSAACAYALALIAAERWKNGDDP